MATSRSLLSNSERLFGSRRNEQLLNSRQNDFQSERRNEQLFQRRPVVSDNNRYLDIHSNHYLDSLQDRQGSKDGESWNDRYLDHQNDILDSHSDILDRRNSRQHLENEYDQYISELGSKSRYSDMEFNNVNSNLGRKSRLIDFDRNTSNLDPSDRYGNMDKPVGMGQNNHISTLTKNNRLLEFDRSRLSSNLGGPAITPWLVGAGPTNNSGLHPLDAVSTKVVSTIELANNLLNLFHQQPQQNNPPSLLDLQVCAPQSTGRMMGNQQRSAPESRFGAGKRKAHWGPAGQNQLSKNLPRKDNNISSKHKPRTSSQSNVAGNTKKTDNKIIDTDYNNISINLLSCHICKKTITEPKSFAAHLRGKFHASMMAKTEEDYALTAEKMREEIRAAESLQSNKYNSQTLHCSMCNLNTGNLREHRSSVGHRKLKKYLHPTCTTCDLNFRTKIQYDEHILTATHLKKLHVKGNLGSEQKSVTGIEQKSQSSGATGVQVFNMEMEKSYVRERFERKKGKKITKDGDSKEQNESKKADETNVDPENLVLDYVEGDDLTGVTPDMIPVYNTERGVGDSFLSEYRCVECKLCNKLLDNEETAKIHLRTWGHHRLFTKLILNKIKNTKNDDQQNKDSEYADDIKQESNDESENWKRRKTSNESYVGANEEHDDQKMAESDEKADSQLPPNDELEDWDQADIKEEKDDDDVVLIE